MTPRLLLYIEEDYILPLAIDADGKVHEYAKDDENRLWLYFNSAEHSVDYAREYRTNVAAAEYGYYGDFFENVAKGKTAIIDGRDLPYFDLLKLSSLLVNIRKFYEENTGDASVNIRTSYVFAESIGFESRKEFLKAMEKNGFAQVSFSKSLSALLVDYAGRTMPEVKFGDHVLLVTSAADTLRLTSAVYDGGKWLSDGTCEVVTGVGDAPLKTAFVRYVVDQVDKNRGYLTTKEKRNREYECQYPNADKWLARTDASGNIFIPDFAYSFDPDVNYSCEVSRRFLDAVLEEAVRNAVGEILAYRNRVMDKHMAHAVLCGPAFDDIDFVNMMRSSLENPSYLCVPSHIMPKALSVFFERYYELEEDFGKYDSIVKSMQSSRAAISVWVESAGKIRSLWEDLNDSVPELRAALDEDLERLDDMLGLCDERLGHSDFKSAYEKLDTYLLPTSRTTSAYHAVYECLKKVNDLQPVFDKVKSVDGARLVTDRINGISQELTGEKGLVTAYKALPAVIEDKREVVAYYESHYEEYISLRSRFNLSNNLKEKRDLIALMSKVTMEPLPDLTIRHVDVELTAELKIEKTGFLGMKKEVTLHYGMRVKGGEVLPCNAVINISSDSQSRANAGDKRCVAVNLDKGISSYEGLLTLPDARIDAGEPIFLFIYPAPDVLDVDAIDAKYVIVNQK